MQNKDTYIDSEFASNCDDKLYPDFKLEEVIFVGDGRFKYRDIELKLGTKIGGGTYGDIFMLEPNADDKDKIPPLVIKQFKKVGSKEDPEIDFVRNNSAPGGAMEECNLIPSKILEGNPNPVNIMLGVRGDLSHFRKDKLNTDKGLDLSFNEFLELGKNVLDMLMCLESKRLRFTDLKDANILYSCFGPNNQENGKIKVYMGDTGSIVKRKAHAYYTFNPYWLKTYFLSLPQFTNLTELQKMVCYSIYGVNSESYIIYAFAILLLRLFLEDPSDIPLILYSRALPDGSPPNSLPRLVTQEVINKEIKKLQGRFTHDENEIVKELLKSLIQEKWWISAASITELASTGVKTRSLQGIMDIINDLMTVNISTNDLSSSALALLQGISSDSVLSTIKEDEEQEILSELSSLSQEDQKELKELKEKEAEIERENDEYFAQEFKAIGDDLSVTTLDINPVDKPLKSPEQKYNDFVGTHLGKLKSESESVESMFETFNKEDNNYKLIIERLKNGLYNEVETVAKCLFGVPDCNHEISLLLQEKYGVDSSSGQENQVKEFVTNYIVRYNTLITVLFCLHFTQNSGINEGNLIKKVIVPFLSLVPSDYINESNFKELVGRYNTIEVDVDGKDAIKIAIDSLSKGTKEQSLSQDTPVVSISEDFSKAQDSETQDLTSSSNESFLSSLEEEELPSIELSHEEAESQKLKVGELKKKEEERLQKIKDQIDGDQDAAKNLQGKFEEEAQMKKDEAPEVPPVPPDSNAVNKTWKPPNGSDNGKNRCWLNAPLYSILQNKVIREKILEAYVSGTFNDNKVLNILRFLITDEKPWVEDKYNYVISELKDGDEENNIPPLFPANTAGGGDARENFINEIMKGEYYDAAITINYLTEVLKTFNIYIYHIETLPFMKNPYVDCDKFDKEERITTGDFWYNCTDINSNTTLIAMVQSYNIYKKDKNGNVIQLDAGHFRAFIPTKKITGDGTNDTPPMNKEDFNKNYEWVKNDALNGFRDNKRSSEPVPGSHSYSFYIFLREPKSQGGGGKKRRVRTNKRRGKRVNRTGKKNRKSLHKSNRRSRKKENTLKKRVRKGHNKPIKRTLKKRR